MDPLAGNQRAHWFADYDAGSVSARAGAPGRIYRRTAERADRSALPGCGGRTGSAVFGSEAADTDRVWAAGFENGAETWRASLAGAGTLDHRSGGCALDARRLHKNEPGQDVCSGGFGDERFDAACSLRRDPSNY